MFGNEINILKAIESMRTGFLNTLFEAITMLGEETILVVLVAIIYYAVDKKLSHRLLFITMLSLGTNSVIKNIARVPRPFTRGVTGLRQETATGYSFPSGHTQNFSTWSMALSYHFKKKVCIVLAVIFSLLLGFSRMYLGAHYLSDVLVALILGFGFAIFGNMLFDRVQNKNKLYAVSFLIITPFAIGFLIKPDVLYEDFFKFYGMFGAFILSVLFENKYCPINYDVAVWKKVLRVILGVILALAVKKGLGLIIIQGLVPMLIFESIKYFVLVMAVFGFLPYVFKKLNI